MKYADLEKSPKLAIPKIVPVSKHAIGKYPFEIADLRGVPGRITALEIHIWHRSDIPYEIADKEVRTALVTVFGENPPKGTELLYRDEKAIRDKMGLDKQVLGINSFYVEIPPPACYLYVVEDLEQRLRSALEKFK